MIHALRIALEVVGVIGALILLLILIFVVLLATDKGNPFQ